MQINKETRLTEREKKNMRGNEHVLDLNGHDVVVYDKTPIKEVYKMYKQEHNKDWLPHDLVFIQRDPTVRIPLRSYIHLDKNKTVGDYAYLGQLDNFIIIVPIYDNYERIENFD
jgi:hypothetical protein